MKERNLSLKEATKFMLEFVSKDKTPTNTNWKNIVEAFNESRNNRRGANLRDLRTRIRRILETLEANPKSIYGSY